MEKEVKSTFDINSFIAGKAARNQDKDGYDKVKFEGYLCSAISNQDEGTKAYFNVNGNGEAMYQFQLEMTSNLNFNIVNEYPNKVPKSEQYDTIRVIRHFRNTDADGDIKSSGGMTAICVLDYATKIMTIYPSFCSDNDNFNKHIGVENAKVNEANKNGFYMKFDPKLSIRENIEVAGNGVGTITWTSYNALNKFQSPLLKWFNS